MEIKVGDFVLINTKYDPENTILIVTYVKNNILFGNVAESPYTLGNQIYGHITFFTKITNPDEIKKLHFIHKLYLLGKS